MELKARTVYDAYWKATSNGDNSIPVYLKSDVDIVIDELKVKLRVQTSNAEDAWKLKDSYHSNYAEAVKELYEKNKEIRHHKYKRCLAMVAYCDLKMSYWAIREIHEGDTGKFELYSKWHKRWLELAEKFKEAQ